MRSEMEKKIRREVAQIISRCRSAEDEAVQKDMSYLLMVLRQQQFEIRNLEKEIQCLTKIEN